MNRNVVVIAALAVGGLALAAPVLRLTSSARNNGVVIGELVNVSAYSQLPLVSRSNSGKTIVLVYKGKDAAEPFKFYEGAFEKAGWKIDHMMGGDTMGGVMDKPATPGAMDKPADTMGGTMDKGLEANLTFKKLNLTLKSSLASADQIKVTLELK